MPILNKFFTRPPLRLTDVKERPYQIGDHTIVLPVSHPLPEYQKAYRLYDRFPLCVGLEQINGWILDIGANVGDSAAAFATGGPKRLLCIEPCNEYRLFLNRNKQAIEKHGSTLVVVPYAVSGLNKELKLQSASGTAKQDKNLSGETVCAYSLDQIVSTECANEKISFIKCDVDGFDWDVLLSGKESISKCKPGIYFECEATKFNIDNYLDLFTFLLGLNYRFHFFDNFGAPVVEGTSIDAIRQLLTYSSNGNFDTSHRTVYYFDCLAYQNDDELSTSALARYCQFAFGGKKL